MFRKFKQDLITILLGDNWKKTKKIVVKSKKIPVFKVLRSGEGWVDNYQIKSSLAL